MASRGASDVKDLLAEAMAEILAGKMDAKLASTPGHLGTSAEGGVPVGLFEVTEG